MKKIHVLVLMSFAATGMERPQALAAPPDVSLRADLERVAALNVFFGHQSVGYDIVEGLADLATLAGMRFPVAEVSGSLGGAPGGFLHGRIDANGNPDLKLQNFSRLLGTAPGPGVNVAFLKFCYVDVGSETDVLALFTRYQSTVASIREHQPSTAIVHFTIPLTTVQGGLKSFVKRLLGRAPYGAADNVSRERYNDLLRAAYAGREPVVDIARIESTKNDGALWLVEWDGRSVPGMVPAYTDDGGHLNREGRARVARELVSVLARIQPREKAVGASDR